MTRAETVTVANCRDRSHDRYRCTLTKRRRALEVNALVIYLFNVVWSSFTERKRGYPTGHGYNLLGFLMAEITESGVDEVDLEVVERGSFYGLKQAVVVSLEILIPDWCAKECPAVLDGAVSSHLKPLKRAAERGVEMLAESKKIRKFL